MSVVIYLLVATSATGNQPLIVRTPPPATTVILPPSSKRPNPVPQGNPGAWATTNDYPPTALQNELEGTTGFSLTVGPDGRVTACDIMSSSGSPELDQATCLNVTRRARFDPALDFASKPISGRYQNRVRWQIPDMRSSASPPLQSGSYPRSPQILNPVSLRIAAEDYPAGARAALQEGAVVFTLDIDSGGKVSNCSVTTTSGFPALDRQSCAVAQKWAFEPARNFDGTPVAGRTSHNIRWHLPKGAVAAALGVKRPKTNPFQNEGTVKLTLDFDQDGKTVDCAAEHIGAFPIFGAPNNISDNFCATIVKNGDIKPFTDADGKARARRVVLQMSVDHTEIPSKSSAPATGE